MLAHPWSSVRHQIKCSVTMLKRFIWPTEWHLGLPTTETHTNLLRKHTLIRVISQTNPKVLRPKLPTLLQTNTWWHHILTAHLYGSCLFRCCMVLPRGISNTLMPNRSSHLPHPTSTLTHSESFLFSFRLHIAGIGYGEAFSSILQSVIKRIT